MTTQCAPSLQQLSDQRGTPLVDDRQSLLGAAFVAEVAWKPQPRLKPDGSGEGNEAQTMHQEELTALLDSARLI